VQIKYDTYIIKYKVIYMECFDDKLWAVVGKIASDNVVEPSKCISYEHLIHVMHKKIKNLIYKESKDWFHSFIKCRETSLLGIKERTLRLWYDKL